MVCYSRPTVYAYVTNFVSIGLFCRPLAAKTPQFLRFFGLRHLVLSPIGNSLTKLNTGAQLQTFHYPTASKSFLYSNAFMAKSGAQTLTFALCCHSNATHAPIANPLNSAQLGGIPYHFPMLHPGPCNSVGMRPRTDRQTHTDTQTRVTTIHFASSTTQVKCNQLCHPAETANLHC